MNLNMLHPAEQLAVTMKRIYEFRLTTTSGGNLSIKDEEGNIWITPGSIDKGNLTKDDMVCIKPDGTIVGRHNPSCEYPFHTIIYKVCPHIKAVLHAHPQDLVAYAIVRKIPNMRAIRQAYLNCGSVGMAKYAIAGSHLLAERIAEVFAQGYKHVLMENHGVIIGAETMAEAFGQFETLETTAEILTKAETLGEINYLDSSVFKDGKEPRMATYETIEYTCKEKEARMELCKFAARSYRQGIINSVQGDFSVRTGENSFVITPDKKDRLYLSPEDIVGVQNGKTEDGKKPAFAAPLHQKIYELHPEINGIIFSQPVNAMAFAITNHDLTSSTIPESYMMMRNIKRLSKPAFLMSPETVASEFDKSTPIVMSPNDGFIVSGTSLLDAFDRLEVTDKTAASILLSRSLGNIVHIDQQGLDEIRIKFNLK